MSRIGLALSGTVAALAFGALAATTVLAQQPPTPPDAPKASPSTPESGAPSERAGDPRADRDRDRERDWRDDRGDRRRWSRSDRDDDRDRDRGGWRHRGERGWDDRDGRRGRRGEDRGEFRRGGGLGMGALARVCRPGGERMMGMLLDGLGRVTQPTDAQRPAFDRLKEAAARAHDTVKGSCPTEPAPITPTGRLAAAEKRLEALLAAVRVLRPALDEYYGSLSEEQKARLYAARGRMDWGRDRPRRDRDRDGDRRGWNEQQPGAREGWFHEQRRDWNSGRDPRDDSALRHEWRTDDDRNDDARSDPWGGRL